MALNRKRKSTAVYISPDDASVLPESDYDTFIAEFCNKDRLALEGHPTEFHLRRLTYKQRLEAYDLTESARIDFVVRCSLEKVVNYDEEVDGTPEREKHRKFGYLVTDSWMSKADIPSGDLLRMYTVALSMSEAPDPLSMP